MKIKECPNCGSEDIEHVSDEKWYCKLCLVEFSDGTEWNHDDDKYY